ncbi:hypothetical protein JM16_005896 [Phytophthora kernoviae]|uniref:EF-hand domain-containing protein n=1 Tax=Phytophthora kernoviae TaxID=325452 RepID=A0A8T0LTZ0_9STRA|nr:hypothetical protein JM16_005896 [Phytophthora kernoviae]
MALPRAKKRSATVFSRDEIGVEQLQSLKEKFADGDLTEKEFVSLFREIVDASLSEAQLTELFQKIDANSDGTVDWDELTNYMFLSGSANDEYTGDDGNSCYDIAFPEKFLGDTYNGASISGSCAPTDIMGNVTGGSGGSLGLGLLPHHKDVITRVVRLERPSVYLTTSKDGSVRTWSANSLAPQQVLASGRDWLTDCCVMKRSNRLAVSSMNRTLSFYDLNSGQLIGDLVDYSRRQCIPLCLAYVEKPSDDREAIVVGDDTGGISVLTCSNQCAALEAQGFSSRVKFQKHTDWITRVKWVHDMRAVVATSLDATVSILDVDRLVVKFEYTRHRKGVFDLAWCCSTRLIASCGMERDIHIWNPYSSQRAVATLKGHTSSVLHLVSDDDNFQIVSAAADNTVKIGIEVQPQVAALELRVIQLDLGLLHQCRRLLTGSHDGEQLKMWNFSNGALVKQFYKKEPQIRFVCSVGWDRQLFVWADKNDESEALPVHILPPDSDEEDDGNDFEELGHERHRRRHRRRQHHTMDVLALAYLPPAYVATAGLDGQVLLWSLNSGELVAPLHQSSGSIESLYYAEKLELLLAAGERGVLLCFDRSMATQAEIPLYVSVASDASKTRTNPETITVLVCDKANTYLVTGDCSGNVKRKIAIANGELTDLITIVKVTRGEILCWDSTATNPLSALKVLDMSEFVRKAGWSKHSLLSQFVGRVFLDGETPFRVAAIAMRPIDQTKPDKKVYSLIDLDAKERAFQPLNESISTFHERHFDLEKMRELARSDEFSDSESDGVDSEDEEEDENDVADTMFVPYKRPSPKRKSVVLQRRALQKQKKQDKKAGSSPKGDEWEIVDKSPTFESVVEGKTELGGESWFVQDQE